MYYLDWDPGWSKGIPIRTVRLFLAEKQSLEVGRIETSLS